MQMLFYDWMKDVIRLLKDKNLDSWEHDFLEQAWKDHEEPIVAVCRLQSVRDGDEDGLLSDDSE